MNDLIKEYVGSVILELRTNKKMLAYLKYLKNREYAKDDESSSDEQMTKNGTTFAARGRAIAKEWINDHTSKNLTDVEQRAIMAYTATRFWHVYHSVKCLEDMTKTELVMYEEITRFFNRKLRPQPKP